MAPGFMNKFEFDKGVHYKFTSLQQDLIPFLNHSVKKHSRFYLRGLRNSAALIIDNWFCPGSRQLSFEGLKSV